MKFLLTSAGIKNPSIHDALVDLLPSLRATVYVGVSAGSMVTAPVFGETYDDPTTPFVIATGLGLVDFALLPHLDHANHPESSTAKVEAWRPRYQCRPTRLTTRPPYRWSTAPSTSCLRDTGKCLHPSGKECSSRTPTKRIHAHSPSCQVSAPS